MARTPARTSRTARLALNRDHSHGTDLAGGNVASVERIST